MNCIVIAILCVAVNSLSSSLGRECSVKFEAEYSSHTGAVMERDRASNEYTVLLTQEDSIEEEFRVFNTHTVEVTGVYYSNDGESDNITVSIDGGLIGTFETREKYGEGFLWNRFRDTGILQNKLIILPGDHKLRLFVNSSDLNGVEIDNILLEVNCTECSESYDTCPQLVVATGQTEPNDDENIRVLLSSSQNTLGLAGVVIGSVFGLVNIIVVITMAICRIRKASEKSKEDIILKTFSSTSTKLIFA